ncbi:S-adenosyl-L-methionine-dependent methyltransferase [Mycena metata]|uniref:DNA (cytosine-5-)-methyltransferase n=1 Tax=Mycena metata TaxID=1033252 RepID=A0AAD7N4K2_9AGAR|nr:S-adenosyl-L-methionine-dependent methyltransferase [Mycena metata]
MNSTSTFRRQAKPGLVIPHMLPLRPTSDPPKEPAKGSIKDHDPIAQDGVRSSAEETSPKIPDDMPTSQSSLSSSPNPGPTQSAPNNSMLPPIRHIWGPKGFKLNSTTVLNLGKGNLPNPIGNIPLRRRRTRQLKTPINDSDSELSELTELESDVDSDSERDASSGSESPSSQSDTDAEDDEPKVERVPRVTPRKLASGKRVPRLTIQDHDFHMNQVFELVIADPRTSNTYKRIVFEVYAIFEATLPSEFSYLHGATYFLFEDYLDGPPFGDIPPSSAVPPGGTNAFILNPGVSSGRAIEDFLVDLPVQEIIHVVRRLGPIVKGLSRPLKEVPYSILCSWIYTAVRGGKEEHFTPIYDEDEQPPAIPAQLGVGDFFCGVGGFSEGFRRAGFPISFGVDKDERAYTSWKLNHPFAEAHWTDIATLLAMIKQGIMSLPEILIALISPPCQGFSTANPGGQYDEGNRQLLESVADIARVAKPYWICVENVPGLLLPRHRARLCKMEVALMQLGYGVSVFEQCASNFGVPQTRRRFILFATRRGLTRPDFPTPTHAWNSDQYLSILTVRDAITDLNRENPRPDNDKGNPEYPRSVQDTAGHTEYSRLLGSETAVRVTNHATGYPCPEDKKHWPKAQWNEPLCTIRTMPGNRWNCVHPEGQRLLTVRELARIQSFQIAGKYRVRLRSSTGRLVTRSPHC